MPSQNYIRWFSDIRAADVPLAGGKNASLGELYSTQGVRVPNGFTTASDIVGICGEAPANFPEIARYLTPLGIDSIRVNPSSILRTMQVVSDAEASV